MDACRIVKSSASCYFTSSFNNLLARRGRIMFIWVFAVEVQNSTFLKEVYFERLQLFDDTF